ncbi:PBP1A family penicillin-binding protein [Emcibacter sp. SYSU 3D8]|uniref:transglycosylase domain-containing protein n=1 Tax=Emcibacter sp. SYSU 3D8 TaxID=3133969 RepID=UPI0031FE8171
MAKSKKPDPPRKTPPKKPAPPRKGGSWKRTLLAWLLAAGAGVAGILLLIVVWWVVDLPDVDKTLAQKRPPAVTILDRHGAQITAYGGVGGEWVPRKRMPVNLIKAVLAIEDRRFYSHEGVDFWGVVRAVVVNIRTGDVRQGGSTLTQQLAKNLFLTPDKTIKRKVQEALLAYSLERRLTKDELLEQYLNRVYFGAGAYGVEAASRRYFAKEVQDISLSEAAMLAGLLKAPSRYSPLNDTGMAAARTGQVLDAMVAAGYLTETRRRDIAMPRIASRAAGDSARYFTDWVMTELPQYVGEPTSDLTVRTTFEPGLQFSAQQALTSGLEKAGADGKVNQGAVVVMTPSGEVRAMVGGRDYQQSEFNRAVRALRQPGSAFKLFVYLAGFEAGYDPNSVMRDSPVILDGWQPGNYNGEFRGPVTLRTAFADSINTVAVKLANAADQSTVVEAARRLGITTPLSTLPSVSLGVTEVRLIELTGAYATIANGGYEARPYAILEVRDADGDKVYKRKESRERVVAPQQVEQLDDLMRAVVSYGTGGNARLSNHVAAGKTGTSQEWRNAWFVGYTDKYVAGVWLGNDDNSPMNHVAGGGMPARIWRDLMVRADQVKRSSAD